MEILYVKLQDAYYAETASAGTWAKIGYAMENSKNFEYGGKTVEPTNTCSAGSSWDAGTSKCKGTDENNDGSVTGSTIANGWTAKNPVKLNDCAAGENWKISATTTNDANATGGASLTYSSAKLSEGCETLTPQFSNIAPVAN